MKPSGNHYLVIKRTCKRVNGRNVPVELGVIGEIRDGQMQKEKNLSYIAPLKTNSKLVKRYKMDEPDPPA